MFLGVAAGPVKPAAAQFLPPGIMNPFADIDPGEDLFASHVIEPDGTTHAVWATQNPYNPASGFDPDIYYSRNDGAGWSAPEIVNPWALTDSASDERPRLAVDSTGTVHCVWQSQHDFSGAGTDWDVFYRSLDPIAGWGAAEPVNSDALTDNTDYDFNDTVPNIAVDGNDVAVIIYQEQFGSNGQRLRFRTLNGSVWSNDFVRDADSFGPASMTVTEDGNVVAVWELMRSPSQNHVIVTSTFVTQSWSVNVELTADTANHIHPTVVTFGSGTSLEKHYVWATNDSSGGLGTDYDLKHLVKLKKSPWEFGPFTINSTAATDGTADDMRPSLCVEPGGVIHVVWQSTVDVFTGTDLDVYHSDNGSQGSEWSDIGLLGLNAPFDSAGEDDADPEIRCSSSHILSGMWDSKDDLGGTVGNDLDIFHALGVGRLYHRPRPAADWANFDNDPDSRVDIARRGGVVHLVWESASSGGSLSTGPDRDIYHVAYSDGVFQPEQLVNTSGDIDGGDDHAPTIAIDSSGNLHVVWSSEENIGGTVGTDGDIFYTMYNGSVWSAPELVNASGTSDSIDDLDPRVAVDAAGGVHVAWYEHLSSISGQVVYSKRAAGVWGAKELPTVPTATDWNPGSFDLAVEPGGVAHLVWNSWANHDGAGSDTDVFWSQRVGTTWATAELVNDYGAADSSPDDTPR
ncbi:MAG: exo-alpha-sialidase, partial [Actinobacteria bacterium]|nr:exo-alpha-sialidase [Actinomycetota bacterium]